LGGIGFSKADRVASNLIAEGVRPGHLIGLWLPRGILLLRMQAGIAKTGAAWLPFDAKVPVERVVICLNDAFCLVTAQTYVAKLDDIDIPIFVLRANVLRAFGQSLGRTPSVQHLRSN